MQVLQGLGDGVEDGTGLALREELLPQDLVQQLAAFHQLRHQEDRAAIVVHLTEEGKEEEEELLAAAAAESVTLAQRWTNCGLVAIGVPSSFKSVPLKLNWLTDLRLSV